MRTLLLICLLPLGLLAQTTYHLRDDSPLYTEFLDKDFPFQEATVDLRGIAPEGTSDNLIPRAVVLPLENDIFVCFDTELLRVAGIWKGDFLTHDGLAIRSYPVPLKKMGSGQKQLPKPEGKVIASTGLYPGWFKTGEERYEDPRPRWQDENELGRGPLPPEYGEWLGIEDLGGSAVLHYSLFGGRVKEHFRVETVQEEPVVIRTVFLEGVEDQVSMVVKQGESGPQTVPSSPVTESQQLLMAAYPVEYSASEYPWFLPFDFNQTKTAAHWPETAATEFDLGEAQGAYAVDHLRIPYPNPWERRIRPYGIDFYPNGDAVAVTYDGDVYRISGMGSNDEQVIWKKIAAGFHEPCSVRIKGEEIYIYSRLGITVLEDHDGDGETDFYRMFCNRFLQSAETRDYAHSLAPLDDGGWVISKGGQQSQYPLPHSGRVLRISADGKKVDYFAYGFRNGFVNSIPGRNLIVASDQQGNWVPTTPFHVVNEGSFLGYQPGAPFDDTPPEEAALWIPHRVAQSGIDPLWMGDERMGALANSILYIEYKKPSVFKIFIPESGDVVQTAGVPLDLEFEVPLLKGAINPADGMVYMVGFQIWDSFAARLEGLCRLRVIEKSDQLPVNAELFKEGVLLSFSEELDPQLAQDPANYNVSSWEYQRAESYGSAQYKADGTPGADSRHVHSILLSEDRKSVFIAIDAMTKTMQLEVQHTLFGDWASVYFTANELPQVTLRDHSFKPVAFSQLFAGEPTPRDITTRKAIISEARGEELATLYGCIGCHSLDGSTEGKSGPTWKGLYRSSRKLIDGTKVKAMEDYLRESILDPTAKMLEGFDGAEAGMPPYKGILSDEDVESLVLFIRSLHRL